MNKVKFEIEFPIHASPRMLYQHFSTPSGLEEWFADKANSRGKIITFFWDDSEEQALVISKKNGEKARYKWVESGDDESYFEFRIQVDEITKDVSLMVTDFAEEDEVEESKMLWENQI
ncbi:MAG: SRPBCC domain-containing protein, partial [Flavobacterium sp.]|nr:SRPBCC domain-containing protein [Flavobacterium sp.]